MSIKVLTTKDGDAVLIITDVQDARCFTGRGVSRNASTHGGLVDP